MSSTIAEAEIAAAASEGAPAASGDDAAPRGRRLALGEDRDSAMQVLVARLNATPDFPAFSTVVTQVNRLARSDRENLAAMSEVVLQDVGLSQKMLRVVNSSYYRRASAEPVASITRAIQVMGVDAMRSLAVSLKHLEHLRQARHADVLIRRFLVSSMAGELAREIATGWPADFEEAGLAAMFQDMGWMLMLHHFPDEALEIESLRRVERISMQTAARRVLRVTPDELGSHMVRQWGFTESLAANMQLLDPAQAVKTPKLRGEWLRATVSAAREATSLVLSGRPDAPELVLPPFIERYGKPLELTLPRMTEAARRAAQRVAGLCAAMNLPMNGLIGERMLELGREVERAGTMVAVPAAADAPAAEDFVFDLDAALSPEIDPVVATTRLAAHEDDGDAAIRLRAGADAREGPEWTTTRVSGDAGEATGAPAAGAPTIGSPATVAAGSAPPASQAGSAVAAAAAAAAPAAMRADRLSEGIAALDLSSGRGGSLPELIRIALETMQHALGLHRVVLCMRDARRPQLLGRLGLGEGARTLASSMSIAVDRPGDLFSAACLKGTDLLISDASAQSLRGRLPPWFVAPNVDARSFVLLPMVLDRPIGMLYGDHPEAGGVHVAERELALLRDLRNRLVAAIRDATA